MPGPAARTGVPFGSREVGTEMPGTETRLRRVERSHHNAGNGPDPRGPRVGRVRIRGRDDSHE